jgi:hypothetical protein
MRCARRFLTSRPNLAWSKGTITNLLGLLHLGDTHLYLNTWLTIARLKAAPKGTFSAVGLREGLCVPADDRMSDNCRA